MTINCTWRETRPGIGQDIRTRQKALKQNYLMTLYYYRITWWVKGELEYDKIEWRFNLERAPWWGGFFERMVGSVKKRFEKVLDNAKLTFDELLTVVVEIESTLNSRPLTYIYVWWIRRRSLTPSHLTGNLSDHITSDC